MADHLSFQQPSGAFVPTRRLTGGMNQRPIANPKERGCGKISRFSREGHAPETSAVTQIFYKSFTRGSHNAGPGYAKRIFMRPLHAPGLRACLKIPCSPVFGEKGVWRGATREHTRQRSVTGEQRRQAVFSPKTLRAAGLLSVACVGSVDTARCGDAPRSPPWPQPKSLAAGLHRIFRHALSRNDVVGTEFSCDFAAEGGAVFYCIAVG